MNSASMPGTLRWFQLGLRDILALVLICSLLLGWWSDHKRLLATAEVSAKDAAHRLAEVAELQDELVAHRDKLHRALFHLGNWRFGANEFPWPDGVASGLVIATNPDAGLIDINLGGDDGLKQGDMLVVYRMGTTLANTKYLAKIRLTAVDATTASGRTSPGAKGTIEKDDHVATRWE